VSGVRDRHRDIERQSETMRDRQREAMGDRVSRETDGEIDRDWQRAT